MISTSSTAANTPERGENNLDLSNEVVESPNPEEAFDDLYNASEEEHKRE